MNVLSFGEILWDIIEGIPHLGGAPLNFAAHAAQCGNQSFIISRLGKDELGEKAFEMSGKYRVDCSLIQWDAAYRTGVVDVTLKEGQPDYVIQENVAYDFIEYNNSLKQLPANQFDVFYFGSLIQRSSVADETLYQILSNNKFKQIFYDVNLRKKCYSESIIKKSLPHCSILKLNIDEVPVLANLLWSKEMPVEDFSKQLTNQYKNISLIIITAAEKGCMIYEHDKLTNVPGVAVKVADAVGAGDAFSAAFMHSFMKLGDALKAAQVANRMGAFVASQHGPLPEYSEEIKMILEKGI